MNPVCFQSRPLRSRGMTLTEILVAVVILALLMGIAFPAYRGLQSRARATQCMAHLRQIGASLNLYAGDHGLRFPIMVAIREDKNDDQPALDTVLAPYVNEGDQSFCCPGDHKGLCEKTGTSYLWNSVLNGQRIGDLNFLGITKNESGIPLVADKENFHPSVGDQVNILYGDGHVDKNLTFTVD